MALTLIRSCCVHVGYSHKFHFTLINQYRPVPRAQIDCWKGRYAAALTHAYARATRGYDCVYAGLGTSHQVLTRVVARPHSETTKRAREKGFLLELAMNGSIVGLKYPIYITILSNCSSKMLVSPSCD